MRSVCFVVVAGGVLNYNEDLPFLTFLLTNVLLFKGFFTGAHPGCSKIVESLNIINITAVLMLLM